MFLQTFGGPLRVVFENIHKKFAEVSDVDRDQGVPAPKNQRACAWMPLAIVDVEQPKEVWHDALGRGH